MDVTAETAGGGVDDSEITITYVVTPYLRAHTLQYGEYTFEFPKNFDIAALYRHLMGIALNNRQNLNRA